MNYFISPAGQALLCLACLPLLSGQVYAHEARNTELSTIVVGANMRAQAIEDVMASVQVLSEQDIRAFSGTGLPQVLGQASGVDARAQGSNNSLSIRGFSVRPGALLINGLRRPGKYGGLNPGLIELDNIRQIEVIRGPMSALYGADATGGAINILTRSPLDQRGQGGHIDMLYGAVAADGQRASVIGRGGVYFGSDTLRHQISIEHKDRQSFAYENKATPPDLSHLKQSFLSYEAGLRLNTEQALRLTMEYVDQDDRSPNRLLATPLQAARRFESYEKERRWFSALSWEADFKKSSWQADIAYGRSKGSTTRSYPLIEHTDYHQWQAQLRGSSDHEHHQLTYGTGWVSDSIDVTINTRRVKRDNRYAYLQDEWSWGAHWTALAGVRFDHFTDFGQLATPRLALQYQSGPFLARLGYGQAYRAPTILEQYSSFTRGPSIIAGNPDLRAEKNRAWELAFQYQHSLGQLDLALFDNRVRDMISTTQGPRLPTDPASIRSRHVYTNIDRATLRGAELSSRWNLGSHWTLQAAWDYLDARDTRTKHRLTGMARHIARLGIHYEQGAWRADLHHKHYFDFYSPDPHVRAGAPFNSRYGTSDLKLAYSFTRAWQLYAGVDNVFNQIQPVNFGARGVTMDPPARFIYAGARYEF